MYELQAKFDEVVKRRIVAGEKPEEAVPAACQEVGIKLANDVEKNIVDMLRFAIAQSDPQERAKTKILSDRIRGLMREGKSTKEAVKRAQDETGVQLGEAGERALIETLDAERDRMKDVAIEVVSAEEFSEMQGEKCLPFQLNGKEGWSCCKCRQHNRKNQDACTMCGHARCDKFAS